MHSVQGQSWPRLSSIWGLTRSRWAGVCGAHLHKSFGWRVKLTESKLRQVAPDQCCGCGLNRRPGLSGSDVGLRLVVSVSDVESEATGSGHGSGRGRPAASGERGRGCPVGRGVDSAHACPVVRR